MNIRHLLIQSVDVETQIKTKTPTGGAAVAWTVKASAVPALVQQADADAIEAYGRLGYKVTHKVYLDTEQSLTISDRIVFEGVGYEVRSVNNVQHRDLIWQVMVERKPL